MVKEYKDITGTENFLIINFDILISVFYDIDKSKFNNLNTITTYKINRNKILGTNDPNKDKKIKLPENKYEYSEEVLRDALYNENNSSIKINSIILNLKSHNWHIQSPQIRYVTSEKFVLSDFNKDELFILGRNIYQTACGGENKAQSFMEDLVNYIKKFITNKENHVLNGILFEIFFDSKGNIRKSLKDNYLFEVFELADIYSNSFEFINYYLSKYSKCFLYLPPKKINKITFEIITNTEKGKKAIQQISVKEKSLLKEKENIDEESNIYSLPSRFLYFSHKFTSSTDLKKVLSKIFYIPLSKLDIKIPNNISYPIYVSNKMEINIDASIFSFLKEE